jgi:hypothetical protein
VRTAIDVLLREAAALASSPGDHQARIRDLREAARLLTSCQDAGLGRAARARVIPPKRTTTALSELRVVEDHESDDRQHWVEVVVDGEPLRRSKASNIATPI